MDVDELWEELVPDYTDHVQVKGHLYKSVIAIRLRIAIGFDNLRVLIVIRAVAAWVQLLLN